MANLRRSQRAQAATYDSNGRDYLATELACTRAEVEHWLAAPGVHQHLVLWYNLCVLGRRRYNEAIDWITDGEDGYFYNKQGLEEDLLLTCLGEGDAKVSEGQERSDFMEDGIHTSDWSTAKLWARAAWRIAQSNSSDGHLFHATIVRYPAAVYGLMIDVLCLAFHSIAYRKTESIWHSLITGDSSQSLGLSSEPGPSSIVGAVELDQSDRDSTTEEGSADHVDVASYALSIASSEEDASAFEDPRTPVRAKCRNHLSPPPAPKKATTRAFNPQKACD
ncbi:hypothetical protein CKM354_000959800 [Cercospora kikuchii]|uniref:Uncharacterized protein n=1 Tax=Cercospora kikuchii TaxID=84275 RepID=A0A9P3FJ91_9PEZI|nr:uncharacterized protein CKM354_000959800 [Cercospora kikuchii]GIZ46472.1 hypothetical protein CKM354_000959800 [Cercospora kikuchii]